MHPLTSFAKQVWGVRVKQSRGDAYALSSVIESEQPAEWDTSLSLKRSWSVQLPFVQIFAIHKLKSPPLPCLGFTDKHFYLQVIVNITLNFLRPHIWIIALPSESVTFSQRLSLDKFPTRKSYCDFVLKIIRAVTLCEDMLWARDYAKYCLCIISLLLTITLYSSTIFILSVRKLWPGLFIPHPASSM